MDDLHFGIQVDWSGKGKEGEGRLSMGEESVHIAAPENMGGKGVGASPEDLLIGAVASCYSGTLFGLLARKGLPVRHVRVRAEGIVTGYPRETKFSRLIVNPTVVGGDESKRAEYEQVAAQARDNCFIGKSIAGNVDYEVGETRIAIGMITPERIHELVELFYARLTKEPYYSQMFAERNVDVSLLKDRQRAFIGRMVNGETGTEHHHGVKQVQERHSFQTTPERAEIWLNHMKAAMIEMKLEPEILEPLFAKIQAYMNRMMEKV